MKKFLLCAMLGCIALSTFAEVETPQKGDVLVDMGIGVGMVDYHKSKALFTQHIGIEYVVMPEVFTPDFTLGVGFYINNGFGAKRFCPNIVGTYDYNYSVHQGDHVSVANRAGYGTANVNIYREDINFLPTVSLRYHVLENLDAYMSFGMGVGIMNSVPGKKWDYKGFAHETVDRVDQTGYAERYSYNDLDHTKWPDMTKSKAAFGVAWYVGARYRLTESWGVNAQFGLIGTNVRRSFSNSYNLFSVGATYHFKY